MTVTRCKTTTPTRLLALWHHSGTLSSQERGDMLCRSHLLLSGPHSPPQEHSVRGLQHKHIIGVQEGSRGLYLRERGDREVLQSFWWFRLRIVRHLIFLKQSHTQAQCGPTLTHIHTHTLRTHLYSSCSAGGGLTNVEEAGAASTRLSSFTGRPSIMDHHGLALEQAHQVGGFLALGHTHL